MIRYFCTMEKNSNQFLTSKKMTTDKKKEERKVMKTLRSQGRRHTTSLKTLTRLLPGTTFPFTFFVDRHMTSFSFLIRDVISNCRLQYVKSFLVNFRCSPSSSFYEGERIP